VKDASLVVSTQGRAFWILDDLGPLEALASQGGASGDRALPGKAARIFNFHHYTGWFWAGYYFAPNPEYGAAISYWLNEPAKDVRVRVLDASGTVLRTLAGSAQPGINRIYWDLRSEPTTKPDPKEPYNPVFRPPPMGPPVAPGTYTAAISVDGRGEFKSTLTVQADPVVKVADADRAARQATIQELYAMQKSGVAAQDAIRPVSAQLGTLRAQLSATGTGAPAATGTGAPAAPEDLRNRVNAVADSLGAVERAITRDLGSANRLMDAISGYTGVATEGQLRQVAWAHEGLTASIGSLNALLQKGVPELYAALQARNLWPTAVRAIPPPPGGAP